MKYTLFSLLLFFTLFTTSCNNKSATDKLIVKETLKQDFEEIKKENPDMDSLKIRMVESLIMLADGREVYLDKLIEGEEEKRQLFNGYIVEEAEFNKVVDEIFDNFKKEKVTYTVLFAELDSLQQYSDNFKAEKLQPLFKEVEEECQKRQQIMDEIAKATDEELEAMITSGTDLSFIADSITVDKLKNAMNYEYESPNELFGFCPYISNAEPIAVEIRRLKTERDKYSKSNFDLFNQYNASYLKLYK